MCQSQAWVSAPWFVEEMTSRNEEKRDRIAAQADDGRCSDVRRPVSILTARLFLSSKTHQHAQPSGRIGVGVAGKGPVRMVFGAIADADIGLVPRTPGL
jgi:hypothetical protein